MISGMQVSHKPNVAIFLDIDGVLGPSTYTDREQIFQKAKEVLGRPHGYYCNNGCNTCSMVQAHLFKKEVVQHLEDLIERIRDLAEVHLIISSTWRQKRTIEELKQIFHMHPFAQYIVDKTVDDELPIVECRVNCAASHVEISYENYELACQHTGEKPNDMGLDDFILRNMACRASQINKWMKEHPGYAAYLVFDDIDEHLTENFGEKYISTDHGRIKILQQEDVEKGYKVLLDQLTAAKVSPYF